MEEALGGPLRTELLDVLQGEGSIGPALRLLRSYMTAHAFRTRSSMFDISEIVRTLDLRTRTDGFRVLNTWDFQRLEFSRDNTPALMLDYYADIGVIEGSERQALSILLDYYFMHVLVLCATRVWDAGDPNENLDRVTNLVGLLQGPEGSGHRFVECAETLLMLALSQFHPEEAAYDRLAEKAWTLNEMHRVRFARLSTAVLAGHLRWGLGVMYKRDVGRMRDDNVGDYPWLLISLLALMRRYVTLLDGGVRDVEREDVVEGIVNGLSPDPWALLDTPATALQGYRAEREEFLELFRRYEDDLLADFEVHRPTNKRYSPLHLHFNFPHNALNAKVLIGLHQGPVLNAPLDALLTREREGTPESESPVGLAKTLMEYSGFNPEGLDQHGAMLVVHDTRAGLRHFNMVLTTIRKYLRA